MFKLTMSPEFWAMVTFEFTDEEGKAVAGSFGMHCKRHDREKLDEMRDDLMEKIKEGEISNIEESLLRQIVTGFREIEVTDEEVGVITAEQTDEMLDFLLRRGFATAMMKSYADEYPKARAKNLSGPRSIGRAAGKATRKA